MNNIASLCRAAFLNRIIGRRTYGVLNETNRGIIDEFVGLGRPFPFQGNPPSQPEDPLGAMLLDSLTEEELAIVKALHREDKLVKNLSIQQLCQVVKHVLNGEKIPAAFCPVDKTLVPDEKTPPKHLSYKYQSTAGRSTITGRITVRHRGGGDPRLIYIVDNMRKPTGIPQKVIRIDRQVRRSADLALVQNMQGEPVLSYVLASLNMKPGDVIANDGITVQEGNMLPLSAIPVSS